MQDTEPTQLTLQNRATLSQRPPRIGLWLVVLASLFIIGLLAVMYYLGATEDGKPIDWNALIARLLAKVQENWFKGLLAALAIFASVVQMFYFVTARHRERLVLDELGIRYVSPLPKALQFIMPSWSFQWSGIRRAEFKANAYTKRPEFVTVVFHTGFRNRTIRPYMWVDATDFQPPSWKEQLRLTPPKIEEIVTEVMHSPVMRFIQARSHIKLAPLNLQRLKPFALEKNPVALAFVALFFVSIIYAFVDTLIFNAESYASQPFYPVYVTAGLTLSLIALLLLRGAKVPITESVVVAVLTGAAFGAALYPGLLRVNQFTDTEGLQTYKYKMIEPAHFIPEQDGLPELKFPDRHREFWSQYDPDTTQEFELRNGGLGFYQINMKPIYNRIQDYYEQTSP
ncbi:MAG: hypothetical protein ACE5H7_11325 [Acidiferrobacterales bacterium]